MQNAIEEAKKATVQRSLTAIQEEESEFDRQSDFNDREMGSVQKSLKNNNPAQVNLKDAQRKFINVPQKEE